MATSTIIIINYVKNINPEWWGIVIAVVSLLLGLFNLLWHIRNNKKEKRNKFDNSILNKIISFLPQEKTRDLINSLSDNNYNPMFCGDIEGLINFLQEPNNKFFNKKINKITKKLLFSTKKLNTFLTTHFFRKHHLFVLYPEQKYSEDEKTKSNYEAKSEELKEIVKNFKHDYNNFLESIRKEKL